MGNLRVTETDDGYRIEVKGKELKGILSKCCSSVKIACCPSAEEEKKK